jgi:hypothetical protein
MAPVQIFLSSVSAEFRSYRDALRRDLDRPNVTVKVQEDFIATGTETLDKLDGYIRQCDAVIHLVGDMTGALAQAPSTAVIRQRYPDFDILLPPLGPFLRPGGPALAYTQWEAWLALYHGKTLIIAVPERSAPRDQCYVVDQEQRAAQEAHLARLAAVERYPEIRFANADRLAVDTLRSRLHEILGNAGVARAAVFQAPPADADYVPRAQLTTLKDMFIDAKGTLRSITIGLHGFGGAGKTTLARLLCADGAMRAACRDGMLWVPVGKNPPDPRAQIADLVVAIVGDDEGCLTLAGARARLQTVLAGRRVLVVLDDVWDDAQARDVLHASAGCARLVTTRNTFALPADARPLDVAAMAADESTRLLSAGLSPGLNDGRFDRLAASLGHWPVLLKLVNRSLRMRVMHQKTPVAAAIDAVESELNRKGIRAFDAAGQVQERDQAVAATIEASLDMLAPLERQRYAELAVFPQDVPIPLTRATELWRLTGGLNLEATTDLVTSRLDPLSLLDYDGTASTLQMHEVFRSYLATTLADKARLHTALTESWGDRPPAIQRHAWRWMAFHRAAAITAMAPAQRHDPARRLVALVGDVDWQTRHEAALGDLPALREALVSALDAAVAVDTPGGAALIVESADALLRFDREHANAAPVLELARRGDLEDARRRSDLLVSSVDAHWCQALLLVVGWLAPPTRRDAARALVAEVQRNLGPEAPLHALLAWVRADLHGDAPPAFMPSVPAGAPSEALIEQLVKRVGGGHYDRKLIAHHGLDPGAQNPDMPPTRGLYYERGGERDTAEMTTRYLAEVDGPWMVAYAAADFARGTAAFVRYLSVYTNYSYAEYRYATLWLLLGHVLRLPRPDGGAWVRDMVVRIVNAALGGASVEFEDGLAITVRALRARAGDPMARQQLETEADRLVDAAMRLRPGRDREGTDTWAHEKRRMLAHAQALGWLLGDHARARRLLDETLAIADSGFAGYQAQACLSFAEAIHVVGDGDRPAALESAQGAAHNVQDVSFCARVTARVNAMRRYWWTPFLLEQRARQLGDGAPRCEFAALHRVGHRYPGRRGDALLWPAWAKNDRSFDSLARLYQRPKDDFLHLNGPDRPLAADEEVAVPDRGFVPHLAARLAAEVLAQAGHALLTPDHLQLLRALVPRAIASPTALDAVLQRLVLAEGRREPPPALGEAEALEALLARRRAAAPGDAATELIATRLPA